MTLHTNRGRLSWWISPSPKNIKKIAELAAEYGAEYHYREIPSSTATRNEGLRYAKHEVIIFSDDDIDLYDNTVKNVSDITSDDSIVWIAGLDDKSERSTSVLGYLTGSKNIVKLKKGQVTASILGRYPAEAQSTSILCTYINVIWWHCVDNLAFCLCSRVIILHFMVCYLFTDGSILFEFG